MASILASGEYSERTLKLSGEVIARNAANYTAWQFRRKCIEVLHADATPEVSEPRTACLNCGRAHIIPRLPGATTGVEG